MSDNFLLMVIAACAIVTALCALDSANALRRIATHLAKQRVAQDR